MTNDTKAERLRRDARDELARSDAKSLGRGVGYALLSISHELAQIRQDGEYENALQTVLEEIDG